MTSAEIISFIAKETDSTKKEVIEALQYSPVLDEIKEQIRFNRGEEE